jgi:hypothetical protein
MTDECETCGAAKNPGLVACSYCETAYPNAPRGIDCPACGDDNRPHLVRCATCGGSLMRSCVFCGSATSIALAGCATCGEAFEGAEERKAGREQQLRQQQMIGLAQSGISLLGQAASAPSARGILGEVFQDLVENAVKKR